MFEGYKICNNNKLLTFVYNAKSRKLFYSVRFIFYSSSYVLFLQHKYLDK